jgi:hypothetical protein
VKITRTLSSKQMKESQTSVYGASFRKIFELISDVRNCNWDFVFFRFYQGKGFKISYTVANA